MATAALGPIYQIWNEQKTERLALNIAHEMSEVAPIADQYVKQNWQTIYPQIYGGKTLEIPISGNPTWQGIGDLATTGNLPQNFKNNLPNGQSLHLLIRWVMPDKLTPAHVEGLLAATGGNPFNDRVVGRAINELGANGGGILKTPPPNAPKASILGSTGAWSAPIALWNNAQPASGGTGSTDLSLKPGHVVYNLSGMSPPISYWLNRYNTGNPEANRMHTSIDMNEFDLNNVRIERVTHALGVGLDPSSTKIPAWVTSAQDGIINTEHLYATNTIGAIDPDTGTGWSIMNASGVVQSLSGGFYGPNLVLSGNPQTYGQTTPSTGDFYGHIGQSCDTNIHANGAWSQEVNGEARLAPDDKKDGSMDLCVNGHWKPLTSGSWEQIWNDGGADRTNNSGYDLLVNVKMYGSGCRSCDPYLQVNTGQGGTVCVQKTNSSSNHVWSQFTCTFILRNGDWFNTGGSTDVDGWGTVAWALK